MMAMLVTHYPAHRLSCRFMRDLPYSIDILAENVLDPSHVPFSHHGMMGNFMTCLLCIAARVWLMFRVSHVYLHC